MTTSSSDSELARQKLIDRVCEGLERVDSQGHLNPIAIDAKGYISDYPIELLELVLAVVESGDEEDFVELAERIRHPRYLRQLLPSLNLQAQLNALDYFPGAHIGVSQAMALYTGLRYYSNDTRVPLVPSDCRSFHPVHIAIALMVDAITSLPHHIEYNAYDAGAITWMQGSVNKITGEELLGYITTYPERSVRVARLGLLLETMDIKELTPYVELCTENPILDEALFSLLTVGITSRSTIDSVLRDGMPASISEGAL